MRRNRLSSSILTLVLLPWLFQVAVALRGEQREVRDHQARGRALSQKTSKSTKKSKKNVMEKDDLPPPPLLPQEVARIEDLLPTTELPESKFELARYYVDGDTVAPTCSLDQDEQGRFVVIEAPFTLKPYATHYMNISDMAIPSLGIENLTNTDPSPPSHLAMRTNPQRFQELPPLPSGDNRDLAVFPPDTRYLYRDTAFPWSTAGLVERNAGGWCTGTMISRRLMLTASHCINWKVVDNQVNPFVKFTPSYFAGEAPFGVAWGIGVYALVRSDEDGNREFDSLPEAAFDFAVVVLDRAIGDLTGYVGARPYSSSYNGVPYWQSIGYPSDLSFGEKPSFDNLGVVERTTERVSAAGVSGSNGWALWHNMDLTGGHSGGPLWGWWSDGGVYIVGVQSFGFRVDEPLPKGSHAAAGGPSLFDLIVALKKKFN